jgi:hypothetical protein
MRNQRERKRLNPFSHPVFSIHLFPAISHTFPVLYTKASPKPTSALAITYSTALNTKSFLEDKRTLNIHTTAAKGTVGVRLKMGKLGLLQLSKRQSQAKTGCFDAQKTAVCRLI